MEIVGGRTKQGPHIPTNTITIYLSATESDFHHERLLLKTEILPEVRAYAQSRGLDVGLCDPSQGQGQGQGHVATDISTRLAVLRECERSSVGPFFLCLIGNKYGSVPLPQTIDTNEFLHIRNAADSAQKDVDLLDEYYTKDDLSVPPVYRLRTVEIDENEEIAGKKRLRELLHTLQFGASIAHRNGLINQVHQYKQMRYFNSVVHREVQEALLLNRKRCLCVMRTFRDLDINDRSTHDYTDVNLRTNGIVPDRSAQDNLKSLRNHLVSHMSDDNRLTHFLDWKETSVEVDPEIYTDYFFRLRSQLKGLLISSIDTTVEQIPDLWKIENLRGPSQHANWQLHLHHRLSLAELKYITHNGMEEKLKTLLKGKPKSDHHIIAIHGTPASGKTTLALKGLELAHDLYGGDCINLVRFSNLTSDCNTHLGVITSIGNQVHDILHMKGIHGTGSIWNQVEALFAIFTQIEKRKHWLIIIDDLHKLRISDQSDLEWLSRKLPQRVSIIVTCDSQAFQTSPLSGLKKLLAKRDSLLQVGSIPKENLMTLVKLNIAKRKRQLSEHQTTELVSILGAESNPFFLKIYCELIANLKDSIEMPRNLTELLDTFFVYLEDVHGAVIVRAAATALTVALRGVTDTEMCHVIFRKLAIRKEGVESMDDVTYRWLKLKVDMGCLLERRFCERRQCVQWRHSPVVLVAILRYLPSLETRRRAHERMAEIHTVQPLVYSTGNGKVVNGDTGERVSVKAREALNTRRLGQLWYHLMKAGDLKFCKSECFFDLEYLMTMLNHTGLGQLVQDLQELAGTVLDADCHLLTTILTDWQKLENAAIDSQHLTAWIVLKTKAMNFRQSHQVRDLINQIYGWWHVNSGRPQLLPINSWVTHDNGKEGEGFLLRRAEYANTSGLCALRLDRMHAYLGTDKQDVQVYDINTGIVIDTLKAPSKLSCLSFLRDERSLLCGHEDGTIRLWATDNDSATLIHTYKEHTSAVLEFCLSHCGQYFISVGRDRYLNLVSIPERKLVQTTRLTSPCSCMVMDSRGEVIVTGSPDGRVRWWAWEDLTLMSTSFESAAPILCIDTTADGTFLLIGLDDGSVSVRAFVTGTETHKIQNLKSKPLSLCLSDDCCRVAIGLQDGKIKLYDFRTPAHICTYGAETGIGGGVRGVRFLLDDSVVMANCKGRISFWQSIDRLGSAELVSDSHADHVTCITISNDGKTLITGSKDRHVHVISIQDETHLMQKLSEHATAITAVALPPDEAFIASGAEDGIIKIWSTEAGIVVTDYTKHKASIVSILVLSDNMRVLSADASSALKLWRAESGETLIKYTGQVGLMAVCPSTRLAVTGERGGSSLNLWTVSDGATIKSVDHSAAITCMVFSHDSSFLLTGSADLSVKVWEATTGKLTQVLVDHDDPISACAMAAGNDYVISGASLGALLVWNLHSGNVQWRLNGHRAAVTAIRSPAKENTHVTLSASSDGMILVHNHVKGFLLSKFDLAYDLTRMMTSLDGRKIVLQFEEMAQVAVVSLINADLNLEDNRGPPPISPVERSKTRLRLVKAAPRKRSLSAICGSSSDKAQHTVFEIDLYTGEDDGPETSQTSANTATSSTAETAKSRTCSVL